MARFKLGIECENLEDARSRWGVGHLVLNLLREYAKNPELQKEFELYLYFKCSIPDDEVLKNPIFIKRVSRARSFNFFYHILLPFRAMRDRLDVLFFPSYMLPPLYIGKSLVVLTNDVYYEYKKGTLPLKYRLAYRIFCNWAARRATKILAISEASKKEVSKLFNIKPRRILVSRLGTKQHSTEEKATEYGEYMLYVAQMFPRRRALESIKAFEKIAPEFPDLNFVLVGKDKYNPPIIIEAVAEANNKLGKKRIYHFEYIDSDKEVEKLYNGTKLFVYISSSEAFGLPPVEAAGSGVPVVVKDSELNHELFGDAAFFVKDETDVSEIASVFREGLKNEEKRGSFIEQNRNISDRLSWSNFAKSFFKNVKENF